MNGKYPEEWVVFCFSFVGDVDDPKEYCLVL